jgi:hypothetical protein
LCNEYLSPSLDENAFTSHKKDFVANHFPFLKEKHSRFAKKACVMNILSLPNGNAFTSYKKAFAANIFPLP